LTRVTSLSKHYTVNDLSAELDISTSDNEIISSSGDGQHFNLFNRLDFYNVHSLIVTRWES